MDRKEFLSRTLQFGMCCGAFSMLGSSGIAHEEENTGSPTLETDSKFLAVWVQSFMETIDSTLDEKERIDLMVRNGRACAGRSAVKLAKEHAGNLDSFLAWFNEQLGEDSATREDDTIRFTWSSCECPIVKNGPDRLSDTYCHCSRGWFHEVLETVTGKPVHVEVLEAVKRGDDRCLIQVRV
jgi:predicted hydrocarbon binding protein